VSNFNSNPIVVNANMASGWRSLQTLNVGNLPSNIQQTSGPVTRQWGIQVVELVWNSPPPGGAVMVTDPNDGTILALADVPAAYAGGDIDVTPISRKWRDFKVTISGGNLLIYYRA